MGVAVLAIAESADMWAPQAKHTMFDLTEHFGEF